MFGKKLSLILLSMLLLFSTGCSKTGGSSPDAKSPDLSAWIVDWDLKRGLQELSGITSSFNTIQLFAAYFDKDGKIFVPESLKAIYEKDAEEIKKEGLKGIYLTIVNDTVLEEGKSIQKDSKLIEGIMLDEKRRKEHIEELVGLAGQGPFLGLTLDYEKVPQEAWDEYAVFIDELGSKLKKKGKNLQIVLEPRSPIEKVKLPRQYEYIMMAYNLHDTRTAPGPKADAKLINDLCDKMIKNFDNIRIAFALGGFDWPEKGKAVAVTELQAEELLSKSGSEKKRYKDSEAVYFNYIDKDGIKHTVCYADTQTLLFWIKTAQQKGISRFSLWRLGGNSIDTISNVKNFTESAMYLKRKTDESSSEKEGEQKLSDVVSGVITGNKVLSLTFNGLPDEKTAGKLLDELDELQIKATFFISGIKAAEEQEIARMIAERGHQIGNSTLSGADLTKVSYEEKVREISKSHDAIARITGIEPKYLRPGHGTVDDEVRKASAICGYENIITYSVNPQDWDNKTPEEIAKFVSDKKKKGGIIILNADKNQRVDEAVPLIHKALKSKGYELVPLWQLVEIYEQRQEKLYTPESVQVKVDPEFKNTKYRILEEGPPSDTDRVAITFDDYGTDDTIDGVLDVLDKYNIKATFFLRAKGVESNPSLALAISERGHEIANHTYSHSDFNTMTPLEIQEDIVKAHNVITSAINKEPSRYMRPPRGIVNAKAAEAIAACGYSDIIMYSVTALDWKAETSAKDISDIMINKSFDGAILLLHMLDNINTTKALPMVIEGLRAKGYKFVTVEEMLNNKK